MPESFVEIWSFIRRRGVTSTPGDRGLFEGNCPNCGASLELNQLGACASCEAVLRNGEYDWVLHQWLPLHSDLAAAWKRKLKDDGPADRSDSTGTFSPSVADALDWAVQAVVADGEISVEESLAVLGLAARQGISQQQAQALINQAVQGKLDPPVPPSDEVGRVEATASSER